MTVNLCGSVSRERYVFAITHRLSFRVAILCKGREYNWLRLSFLHALIVPDVVAAKLKSTPRTPDSSLIIFADGSSAPFLNAARDSTRLRAASQLKAVIN